MNKEAVALAADSAVTYRTEKQSKIFTSANKIFALSKYHPVGIMVYGDATFMDVPWETIIKTYRNVLGRKSFDSLEQYADDFIDFLRSEDRFSSSTLQEKYVNEFVTSYFYFLKKQIEKEAQKLIQEKKDISENEFNTIISETIDRHYEIWKNESILSSIPTDHVENLIEEYGPIFDKVRADVFEELQLSRELSEKLTEIGASLFAKSPDVFTYAGNSGVLVAGFG